MSSVALALALAVIAVAGAAEIRTHHVHGGTGVFYQMRFPTSMTSDDSGDSPKGMYARMQTSEYGYSCTSLDGPSCGAPVQADPEAPPNVIGIPASQIDHDTIRKPDPSRGKIPRITPIPEIKGASWDMDSDAMDLQCQFCFAMVEFTWARMSRATEVNPDLDLSPEGVQSELEASCKGQIPSILKVFQVVRLFKQGKDKSGPYLPSVSLQKRRSGEDILPSELDEMPDVRAACLAVAVASSKEVPTYFGGRGIAETISKYLKEAQAQQYKQGLAEFPDPAGGVHYLQQLTCRQQPYCAARPKKKSTTAERHLWQKVPVEPAKNPAHIPAQQRAPEGVEGSGIDRAAVGRGESEEVEAPRYSLVGDGVTIEDALGELARKCVRITHGWWTYELCHRTHIRQYHQEKNQISSTNSIGTFDAKASAQSHVEGAPLPALDSEDLIPGMSRTHVHPYYRHVFNGGNSCDMPDFKGPRRAIVRFACSPDERTHMLVKEPSPCRYTITLFLPAACTHPDLAPRRKL